MTATERDRASARGMKSFLFSFRPEEIASLALFLMSDDAGWITGTTVSIDGGRALMSAR